jgi:predicted DsbA family dithiol-disulfide isomerase
MQEQKAETVAVTIYSDYTCPWCYLGLARFETLQEALGERVDLLTEWKPFEIHPEVPPEGMPVSALGYPPEQWDAMQATLRRAAEAEGLELGNRPKVSNTHRALVASAYVQAAEPEHFDAFHHALFRAYFTEGRDLGDPAVIRDVAAGSGVDVDAMETALEQGSYESAVSETGAEARRHGITGTPTFVFDGRYAAVGAQPAEELRRVVERVLSEKPA